MHLFDSIFTYSSSEEGQDYFQFYMCTFNENFGPWKLGQRVGCLSISLENGSMTEYGDGFSVTCDIKIVPRDGTADIRKVYR